jgi:hypothetical protein
MSKSIIEKNNNKPLPIIISEKWNFKLNFHNIDGDLYYAIEDWITGIVGCSPRQAQNTWKNMKKSSDVVLKTTSLSYKGTDNKIYNKPHTDDHGLYLIAQSLKVTKKRPVLRSIKSYLSKAGVFVDNIRTNKDGTRDRLRQKLNTEKPDEAINEGISAFRRRGRSDDWIKKRLQGKIKRNSLTSIMSDTCIGKPYYGKATDEGYKGAFSMIKDEIVKHLGLSASQARALRDHLSGIALQGIDLYESAASHKMKDLNRKLTQNEQSEIIKQCASMVAPSMVNLANFLGIDLLSGKKLISSSEQRAS